MAEPLFAVSIQDLVDVVGLIEENEVILTVPNRTTEYPRNVGASPRRLSSEMPPNLSTTALIPATVGAAMQISSTYRISKALLVPRNKQPLVERGSKPSLPITERRVCSV